MWNRVIFLLFATPEAPNPGKNSSSDSDVWFVYPSTIESFPCHNFKLGRHWQVCPGTSVSMNSLGACIWVRRPLPKFFEVTPTSPSTPWRQSPWFSASPLVFHSEWMDDQAVLCNLLMFLLTASSDLVAILFWHWQNYLRISALRIVARSHYQSEWFREELWTQTRWPCLSRGYSAIVTLWSGLYFRVCCRMVPRFILSQNVEVRSTQMCVFSDFGSPLFDAFLFNLHHRR